MTFLFFLYSLLVGWTSYNLYRPVFSDPRWAVASFLSGWVVGELALHFIAGEMLIVFLFAWGGAIDGFYGALGLLICSASWLAKGYFYMTGERAAPAVESALAGALGADYRDHVAPVHRDQFAQGPDYQRIKLPFAPIDPRVEVIKDLPFGRHGQRLDIYRPRHGHEKCPVLLQIHGGAWTEKMGSKNEQALPLMSHMALRGWIAVSVDYRLCPKATFPEHIVDCKEGIQWIRDNIESYGGDPDFIAVTGGSAGGHLSALVALTPNDPKFQPGFEQVDTTVQAAVPFYGVYDLTDEFGHQHHDAQVELFEDSLMKLPRASNLEAYQQASPRCRINPDAPPFFIIHGDQDSLVPVAEARDFAEQLRNVSRQPVAYAEIEGAQHAFDMFASVRSEHTKNAVERFLAFVHSGYLREKGDASPAETADEANA